jgi:hypothetical protein
VLSVLDGAVLVVSGVEGVRAQTRVLMRTLQRLRIPTLIFVNKLDRRGADVALPGLARGEGVFESAFERYEPVRGVLRCATLVVPIETHRYEHATSHPRPFRRDPQSCALASLHVTDRGHRAVRVPA